MANKVKVELNSSEVRALLKSEGIMSTCEELANGVIQRTGCGSYETEKHVGRNRVNVAIVATDYKTVRDNLKNNTLIKALGT